MRACAPCDARVCTAVLRALSVCTVVYAVPFPCVGLARVGVPWQRPAESCTPNPEGRHDPTAR